MEEGIAATVEMADGGVAIATTTRDYGGGEFCDDPPCANMWLLRLESDLMPRWQRTYATGGTDSAHGISATGTGGVLFAGETDSINGSVDVWALRVDPEGRIDPGCPNGIGEETTVVPEQLDVAATDVVGNRSLGGSLSETAVLTQVRVRDLGQTRQCAGVDLGEAPELEEEVPEEEGEPEEPEEPTDPEPNPEPTGFVLVVHARSPLDEPIAGADVLVFDRGNSFADLCSGTSDTGGLFFCRDAVVGSEVFIEVLVDGGELFGSANVAVVDQGSGRMDVFIPVN